MLVMVGEYPPSPAADGWRDAEFDLPIPIACRFDGYCDLDQPSQTSTGDLHETTASNRCRREIDIDGTMIGMRYPTEVNLIGDAEATLAELISLLSRKPDRSWREQIEQNVARWWETIERQSMLRAEPVNPMRVVWELSQQIPDDAIVTADSGSSTNWYARCLRFRRGMCGSLSGTLATIGPGVAYAIGAKFAHPDRLAIALVGDGAMQMKERKPKRRSLFHD